MEIGGISQQTPYSSSGSIKPEVLRADGTGETTPTAGPTDKSGDQSIQRQVAKLKETQTRVINHEMAHKAVGGRYAGAINYNYSQGPDGKRYISGGDVSIDVSKDRTPEETMAKMKQVRAAALAPADPSPQDLAVAAEATRVEGLAAMELRQTNLKNPYKTSAQSLETGSESRTSVSVYA